MMIVYIISSKNSTRELLQLINTFSKVAGYKINSKKSVVLLYTNDEGSKKKIVEATAFTIAMNNIKCLGVILKKFLDVSDDADSPGVLLSQDPLEDI